MMAQLAELTNTMKEQQDTINTVRAFQQQSNTSSSSNSNAQPQQDQQQQQLDASHVHFQTEEWTEHRNADGMDYMEEDENARRWNEEGWTDNNEYTSVEDQSGSNIQPRDSSAPDSSFLAIQNHYLNGPSFLPSGDDQLPLNPQLYLTNTATPDPEYQKKMYQSYLNATDGFQVGLDVSTTATTINAACLSLQHADKESRKTWWKKMKTPINGGFTVGNTPPVQGGAAKRDASIRQQQQDLTPIYNILLSAYQNATEGGVALDSYLATSLFSSLMALRLLLDNMDVMRIKATTNLPSSFPTNNLRAFPITEARPLVTQSLAKEVQQHRKLTSAVNGNKSTTSRNTNHNNKGQQQQRSRSRFREYSNYNNYNNNNSNRGGRGGGGRFGGRGGRGGGRGGRGGRGGDRSRSNSRGPKPSAPPAPSQK